MRSSEVAAWRRAAGRVVLLAAAAGAAACSVPGAQATGVCDRAMQALKEPDRKLAVELQQAAVRNPLYAAAAAGGAATACNVSVESGAILLRYQYPNGASYRVRRDPGIEATEFHAELSARPDAAALSLLQNAERSAFGPAGCGIDWQQAEAGTDGSTTLYRGNTCNCMARLRRGSAETPISLTLRSAC